MSRYCKAYKLEDLRKYSKWADSAKDNEKELNDDSIVYIQENFSVTTNPLDLDSKDDYIFEDGGSEWESYCKDELKFEVPVYEEISVPAADGEQATD